MIVGLFGLRVEVGLRVNLCGGCRVRFDTRKNLIGCVICCPATGREDLNFLHDPVVRLVLSPDLACYPHSQDATEGGAREGIAVPAGATAVGIGRADAPARCGPGDAVSADLQADVGFEEAIALAGYGTVDERDGRDRLPAGKHDARSLPGAHVIAIGLNVDVLRKIVVVDSGGRNPIAVGRRTGVLRPGVARSGGGDVGIRPRRNR